MEFTQEPLLAFRTVKMFSISPHFY
jgi:hypothetical protein